MQSQRLPTEKVVDSSYINFARHSSMQSIESPPIDIWEEEIRNGFAPVDPITGIPLHIAPSEKPSWVRHRNDFDDNHHIFHWNSHALLQGQGGRVVRHSRLLRGPRWAHQSYHEAFSNGISYLPDTDEEKFFIGIMACADIVPQYAVDVSRRTPSIVRLGEKALQTMLSSRVFPEQDINKVNGKDNYFARRGYFFMQQAMDMGFAKVDTELLEQFLEERDQETKRHFGMMVISAYLDKATAPIIPAFKLSRNSGLLPEHHPTTPVKVIKSITHKRQEDYFATISKRAKERLAA